MNKETSLSEDYLKGWADGKIENTLIWKEKVLRLNKILKEMESKYGESFSSKGFGLCAREILGEVKEIFGEKRSQKTGGKL